MLWRLNHGREELLLLKFDPDFLDYIVEMVVDRRAMHVPLS